MNDKRKELLAIAEAALDEILPSAAARPAVLSEAMRYAVGTGGKRIRPLVCLAAAEAVGGRAEDAAYPAAAIELLHNYTLVHDDLPAMDDDTLRRGRPTVWAKYGEANAILVGDALQALAFRAASRAPRRVAEIVAVLGEKGVGVVRGQVEDVGGEKSEKCKVKSEKCDGGSEKYDGGSGESGAKIGFIYEHKTADLFVAAAAMGGLAGGGSEADVARLEDFAMNLGLAFQYEDDLLDGDSPLPREETARRARAATDAAKAALAELPGDTAFLAALAEKLVDRSV